MLRVTLEAIGIIDAIARGGSFAAAAESLHKVPSTISYTVAKLEEQLRGLTQKRDQLDQRANELRQNLQAIAKNPAAGEQRAKWTKQLDEFTSEGNKLGAQLADLEAKRLDGRVELENALENFELTMPTK